MRVFAPILTLTAVLATLASCSNKNEEEAKVVLSHQKLVLNAGEERTLTVSGVPGADWSSDEQFVATVFGGEVKGEHVGKTYIRATYKNSTAVCEVTVNPTSDLLPRPILKWGASPEEIRALEPGTFVGERKPSDAYYAQYDREGKVIEYEFINNKLFIVARREYALSYTNAVPALMEQYQFLRSDAADKMIFYHPIDKYYVVVYISPGCIFIYTQNQSKL